MTAIAGSNASSYGATASMLRNAAASSAGAASSTNSASDVGSKAPKDTVELSDYAKTMLMRARTERAAAAKLTALVAEVVLNGKGQTANKASNKPDADDGTALFKALTGQFAASQLSGASNSAQPLGDADPADYGAYLDALLAENTRADGTVKPFSVTVNDVIGAPSTPAEIDEWFKTTGQNYVAGAQLFNDVNYNVMAQAIQDRTLIVRDARDFADLNFHNAVIFEGGSIGASVNGSFSYNHDAAIFKDPTMSHIVNSDGTVLSWKKDRNA